MLGVCFFCSYCGKTKRNLPRCLQKKNRTNQVLFQKLRRPESNRYGYHYPRDFKSRASASSATTAYSFFHTYLLLKSGAYVQSTVALSRYVNGRRWIRTTEGSASRFTVCPLWPLGNSPMAFSSSNDDTIEKRKNQYFFEKKFTEFFD